MFSTKTNTYQHPVTNVYEKEGLKEAIIQKIKNTCSKQDGFCIEVNDVNITEICASIKGNIICTSRCSCTFYMPVEGSIVNGLVLDCFEQKGIYCIAYNCLKILIPFERFSSLMYFENGAFKSYEKNGNIIQNGDEIRIFIEKLRYQNSYYRAIGRLDK